MGEYRRVDIDKYLASIIDKSQKTEAIDIFEKKRIYKQYFEYGIISSSIAGA